MYAGYISILFSTDLVVDFWDKDAKVCILAVSVIPCVVFKPVSALFVLHQLAP